MILLFWGQRLHLAIDLWHNSNGILIADNLLRHRLRLARVDLVEPQHGVGDFGVLEKIGALRPIFHFLRRAASGARKNELSVTLATKSIAAFGFQNGVSQIL